MDLAFTGQHKSIKGIAWKGIPKFAVVTGLNGTGKSQLLELILKASANRNSKEFTLSGAEISNGGVLYLSSEWTRLEDRGAVGFQAIQGRLRDYWNDFREQFANGGRRKSHLNPMYEKVCKAAAKSANLITEQDFAAHFDLAAPLAQTQVFNETIAEAFFDYRLRQLEAADGQHPSPRHPPPWTLLREIIESAKLPFSFKDPSKELIRTGYQFSLFNTYYQSEVKFSELSSGEKVLLSLVFWMFHVSRSGVFPELLLLDEPDAHLHPATTHQFLRTVKETLVDKHSVRVILTTHSPATVAFSPRESLFEMFPSEPRIRRVTSKSDVIERLTAGLLRVSEPTQVVLVEDEDDERFYNHLFRELSVDLDRQRHETAIHTPLIFVQSSRPRQQNRREGETCGGRSEVEKWVGKLRGAGLDSILGLVDWDQKQDAGDNIHLLKRYCLENYLLDPILIYCILVNNGVAPSVDGVPALQPNRESSITGWTPAHLQKIADFVHKTIWNRIWTFKNGDKPIEAFDRQEVTFQNGAKLQYPCWLINDSGKTLLKSFYMPEFDPKIVNRTNLTEVFQRVMFVPMDLIQVFQGLQSDCQRVGVQ